MSEDKIQVKAEDFDVEQWLTGAPAFTKTVRVTNKPRAGLELEELADELSEIEKAKDSKAVAGGPRRTAGSRAGSAFTPAEIDLKKRMKELLAELDQTWMEIELRSLDPFESNRLADTVKGRFDRLAAALELTGTVGGKKQSLDFWKRTVKTIGAGQAIQLEETINKMSMAAVTPDFSVRVSSLLDGAISSSS